MDQKLNIKVKTIQTPGAQDRKKSSCNAGNADLTHGSRRSLGEGKGYSLQYSCQRIGTTSY